MLEKAETLNQPRNTAENYIPVSMTAWMAARCEILPEEIFAEIHPSEPPACLSSDTSVWSEPVQTTIQPRKDFFFSSRPRVESSRHPLKT